MKMNRVSALIFLPFVLALWSIGFPAFCIEKSPTALPIRRFAFIVGSNDGGGVRIRLQYATSDAQSFAQVMMEMGGVSKDDSIVLLNPDYNEFSQSMKMMNSMMSEVNISRERREFILYYSGHSDEEGLLLGPYRYSYKKLRDDITNLPAEVHIAILDSCSSGALTRSKGGVRKPAFLLDTSNVMEGHAFLTSSSADEAAQESDRIKASFFTHYLVSGLRGAADATGDGKVTLNEAYHYAFNETLASTEKTLYGAQHPTYDISLTGTGDIVLTDLRETSAGLTVSKDISGRLFVRDHYGSLVVELNKPHGNQINLGLEPGMYKVTLDSPGGKYEAHVNVRKGERALLATSDLRAVEDEVTASRGDEEFEDDLERAIEDTLDEDFYSEPREGAEGKDGYTTQFVHLGVTPSISYPSSGESNTLHHLSFNVLWGESYRIEGFELGLVGNVVHEDLIGFQTAGVSNIVRGELVGAQISSFHNLTGKDLKGAQITAGLNRVNQHAYGAQIGMFGNHTMGDMLGLQLSALTGITEGSLIGAQISGIMNIADYAGGVQIGLINFGYYIQGAQIGLINIAEDVTGTQIGLINISDEVKGDSVGLITYSKEGQRHFEIWGDSTGFTHLGYRLGTTHVYTLFTAAYNPFSNPGRWSYGVGLGGELPIDRFFINLDAAIHNHHRGFDKWNGDGGSNFVPEVRALGGFSLARRFGVYAGGSVQFFIPGWYSEQTMAGYINNAVSANELTMQWTILAGLRF